MNRQQHDPIMAEVRRVREALAARFKNDPDAIVRYLNEQRRERDRKRATRPDTTASDYQSPPAA